MAQARARQTSLQIKARLACLIHLLALAPLPASAAPAGSTQDLPPGCAGILTIQQENCEVLNYWACAHDPQGEYWLSRWDRNGVETVRQRYHDLSVLESYRFERGTHDIATITDDELHADLMRDGVDTYAATYSASDQSSWYRVTGQSQLTGEITVIDGVRLHNVRSLSAFTYPSGASSAKTVLQYVMDDLKVWVPYAVVDGPNDDIVARFGPVDFIWPGDSAFMTTVPTENCTAPLS